MNLHSNGTDRQQEIPAEEPAIIAEGARSIIVREAGRKVWEFAADRITVSADRSSTEISGITKGILYRNGEPLWRLSAQRARLEQQTWDVDARGAVTALGPNGLRVRTKHVVWKHVTGRLLCPERVYADVRGMQIATGSASYEVKNDELRCARSVIVTSKAATLTSPRATAHPKQQWVSFEGGTSLIIHPRSIPGWPLTSR